MTNPGMNAWLWRWWTRELGTDDPWVAKLCLGVLALAVLISVAVLWLLGRWIG